MLDTQTLAAQTPPVTQTDVARLAQALITAANTKATYTVMITPSLTDYYRAPEIQTVHAIGRYYLRDLEHMLRAWGLPEITYQGDSFRFDQS